MTDWAGYTALSRELSAELRDDAAWRDEVRDAHEQGRRGLAGIAGRLDEQRRRLAGLARETGGPAPDLTAVAGPGGDDAAAAAVAASSALDRADEAIERADHWAGRPRLLPGMSVLGRALVVHGVTGAVAFLVSFGMFAVQASQSRASVGDAVLSALALPLLAYGVSLVVLFTAGRPRRPDPDESPLPTLSTPVLGLVVSYGVMVTCWLLFIAVVAALTS
ncbi:hypothetical protein Aph02nite_65310 [Actinoplanes philippinensis]|uniref:Uncharacterized protein n=1 Tax=Actinoplanes philippinensis TaxID=35752 RepID=A0A1I2LBT6_9ACTN|nr:hypothetical protein [Actinoplanes philippinensis]GIE80581.1 hypothetical protein Aph02nite_65310 [Actinoplanes philippinensis]SFF76852.1 hypothetical protein SAMN05421541_12144 [Actinoplanes philippinensis]